jgi:ubiquinone/menaquinone biosynthesis C-methylase UbiE
MNLREFLPAATTTGRALDVGSGTGPFAFRLAELGFSVDLLDSSDAMLAIAREQADGRELSRRTSFHLGDGRSLSDLFEPSSFDVVVCHNVIEYQDEPLAVLLGLAHVLKKNAESVVSVLVRNRNGEVLKAAIKSNDFALAESVLTAGTVVESLYGEPVRVFDPADLRCMMECAGLQVVAERGVRIVADYMDGRALTNGDYGQLQKLELLLGAKPEFAAVARYTQFIARASAPSAGAQQ